jgi:hypothetical protein
MLRLSAAISFGSVGSPGNASPRVMRYSPFDSKNTTGPAYSAAERSSPYTSREVVGATIVSPGIDP